MDPSSLPNLIDHAVCSAGSIANPFVHRLICAAFNCKSYRELSEQQRKAFYEAKHHGLRFSERAIKQMLNGESVKATHAQRAAIHDRTRDQIVEVCRWALHEHLKQKREQMAWLEGVVSEVSPGSLEGLPVQGDVRQEAEQAAVHDPDVSNLLQGLISSPN